MIDAAGAPTIVVQSGKGKDGDYLPARMAHIPLQRVLQLLDIGHRNWIGAQDKAP